MLKIKNACKKFGGNVVLNNINMSVAPNRIIGLAGPSGSGKTTLLRCIQGLEKIDTGMIECDYSTGFMFQDFQLFPHMTVIENLIYAPRLLDTTKDHKIKAFQLLTHLSIADKSNDYPHKLSGGQKQRVALARSLMMHPKLLLCDEPTSGLDVATISDVVDLLKSVQQMGVTMIIASHDLDFLTQISDQIILLKHGAIVASIEPKLLEKPIECLKKYY